MLEVAALEAEHGCHELRDGAAVNPVLGVSVGRVEDAVKLQKACCRSKDVDDESNADKRRHFELAFDDLHFFYGGILDSSVKDCMHFIVIFLAISIIYLLHSPLLKIFFTLTMSITHKSYTVIKYKDENIKNRNANKYLDYF